MQTLDLFLECELCQLGKKTNQIRARKHQTRTSFVVCGHVLVV